MKKGAFIGKSNLGSRKDDATDTKFSLRSLQDNLDNLAHLQQEHRQRLQIAEEECAQLTKFQDDYVHLQKRLKTLPDKTSHEVMVPFGPLAFMPGRLIHTNEILVLLGDNWFAERSAKEAVEIVNRRIKDCNEKIKTAESQKNIHLNWLKETSGLFEDKKGQIEIIEELTEEEFEESKEEHRKKVVEHYENKRQMSKENAEDRGEMPSDDGASGSQDNFVNKLDDSDRKAYETIMKRLDQLELEEDEESVGSQDTDDYDIRNFEISKEESHGAFGGAVEFMTVAGEEAVEEANDVKLPVKSKKKLKRRVSWADDKRPLHTVIPNDKNQSVYRIKYTTKKQLSLPFMEGDGTSQDTSEENEEDVGEASSNVIQSPSDIYKVFRGGRRSSLQDPPPRGILKKTFSNPEMTTSVLANFGKNSLKHRLIADMHQNLQKLLRILLMIFCLLSLLIYNHQRMKCH